MMAMLIGWLFTHGCLAICARYCEWWNTRLSPLNAWNTSGIARRAAALATTERAVRTC